MYKYLYYIIITIIIAIISIIFGLLFSSSSSDNPLISSDFTVLSWNVRGSDLDNGPTTKWESRIPVVKNILNKLKPQLIGTQEARNNQIKVFNDFGLSNYKSIMYDNNILEFITGDIIWLSESGEYNKRGWDASLPRSSTWALFKHKNNNKTILCMNIHLDHVGYQSRIESVKLLSKYIKDLNNKYPDTLFIILGDFNSVKYTPVWNILMNNTKFNDVALVLSNQDSIEFTYHHFHGLHFNTYYMRIIQYISYYVSCTEFGRNITKIPSCLAPNILISIYKRIFSYGKVHHIDWILYNNYNIKPIQFKVLTDHIKVNNTELYTKSWWNTNPKEYFHRNIIKSNIYASDHFPILFKFNWNKD